MGVCATVLGVTILADRECREQNQKARQGRIDSRQGGRTDRTAIRQGGRTDRTELRTAPGATVPAQAAIGTVLDSALGIFGLGADESGNLDITPLVLAGGAGVALLALSRRDKRRR